MSEQISVYDLLTILLRRKWTLMACFFGVMLLVVAAAIVARPKFASQAKLFVRVGRESIGLDPTATITGQVLGLNVERETEINSVAELVRSRNVLEAAVDTLGAERVLQTPEENFLTPVRTAIDDAKLRIKQMLPQASASEPLDEAIAAREEAVEILNKSISVSVPKASSVVTVSAQAFSPSLAQEIAAAIVDRYLEAHAKSSRPEGSLEFFTQQTESLRDNVTRLRDELAQRRVSDGIVSLESQFQLLGQNKMALEAKLLATQGERDASAARMKALEESLDAEAKTVVLQEIEGGLGAPSTGMRRQLFELEIQASQLLSRLQPSHPTVKALNEQIEELRAIVGQQQGDEDSSRTTGLNPAWQELQVGLVTEKATLSAHEAALAVAQKQLAEVNEQVATLNHRSREYEELSREIDMAERNYQRYAESLERARIDAELENNNITNVTVAQDATLVRKPIFPDKKTILIIGTCLAALCAFGAALLVEFLDRSLRKPEEIEAFTDLPVIATIPKTSRHLVRL